MKFKKVFKSLMPLCLIIIFLLLVVLVINCLIICLSSNYLSEYSFNLASSAFVVDILRVFLAMMIWIISPVGILFFLGLKLFFSGNGSVIKRNFAFLLQFLSFLLWFSSMLILLIVYFDAIFYQIFSLDSDILSLVIRSGFGFIILFIILIFAEKKIILEQKNKIKIQKDKDFLEEERKDSVKIMGVEIIGVKNKIKKKIKEIVKRNINNRIDRL